MNPRARGRGLFARGLGISGRTSVFIRNNKNATLHRSAPETWTLPRTAHRKNNASPQRVSRHLQHTTLKPAAYRISGALGNAVKTATARLSGKFDAIGAAPTPTKFDVIVVRKRRFEVPRGRRVSERMWAEFINGNRKVTFSPTVKAKLVPSKEECYPTVRYKAACFFSKYHTDVETKRIAPGGPGEAAWLVLLSETRQAAAESRKKQKEQQQLRTDQGVARKGKSGLQHRDGKDGVQTGGKQGDGNDGCAVGSSVSERSMMPETSDASGWPRFSGVSVGRNDKTMGAFKVAKTFRRWLKNIYRVSWTPHNGGADSRFDWVMGVPAGSQYDIV